MSADSDYQARARRWFAAKGGDKDAAVGAMLRPTDVERWNAWKTYFRAQGCTDELRSIRLCEQDRWVSREPGTNFCWRMVPTDWPHEFDPKGAADAGA